MDPIRYLKKKFRGYKKMFKWFINQSTLENRLGYKAFNAILELPATIDNPAGVFLYENTKLRGRSKIHNAEGSNVIIKKYSVVAAGCTFVTDGHRSTVGIPQFILGDSHINDKSGDIVIEEDVWIGANCTVMPGIIIGRGAVVGAGSIVTKNVPPYAVVVGTPAKIIAKTFDLKDVIHHEQLLYNKSERLSEEELNKIFQTYFQDKKVFGINRPLSSNENKKLASVKKALRFIEPF